MIRKASSLPLAWNSPARHDRRSSISSSACSAGRRVSQVLVPPRWGGFFSAWARIALAREPPAEVVVEDFGEVAAGFGDVALACLRERGVEELVDDRLELRFGAIG